MKISSVAWGFSPIKIDYSDYPKSSISKINEEYVVVVFFSIKYRYLSRLFCCNHTCYCVKMAYVTSASRFITSA